jgi:hypothetical protein
LQYPFSCTEPVYLAIESALSPARLARYMPAAGRDRNLALRTYVWNARLCEALYLPFQISEVCVRNAVHKGLEAQYGLEWHQRGAFTCTLPDRLGEELRKVIQDERAAHGLLMTNDHIVSGLSFGFWVHMFTTNYDSVLWPRRFNLCFPNKPGNISRADCHAKAERIRVMRNRVAHHKPVFDKRAVAEYNQALEMVSWICTETAWFVKTTARVNQVINQRPR